MMQLNKKNWKEYSFGDIAIQQKEIVDRQNTTLEKYIAGGHMTTEDIHIRQWGIVGDSYLGPAFHRKFCKDDILYGSRRTYLKKVVVAHFDGITANTTFVIRSNNELIIPELLPFLMLSDSFTDHSVKNSKGSVNPYINWKDIANYKFNLPPLDEQKRLVDLLWSVDETITVYEELLSQVLLTRSVVLKDVFLCKACKITSINELPIKEINGMWKTVEVKDVMQVSIIRSTEINPYGEISYDTAQKHVVKKSQFADKKLIPGDIIIERSGGGPEQPVGRVCYFDRADESYTFSNFTSVIRIENQNEVLPKYLFNFLLFFYEMKGTVRLQKQTTGIRNLDYDLYRKVKISMRNIEEQKECINTIEKIEKTRRNVEEYIVFVQRIKMKIINQIFGGKS